MVSNELTQKAILYDLRKNQTLIGKCKISPDFIFIEVNDIVCEYLKCTPAQLIGQTFTAITLPDDNEIDVMNAHAVKDGKIDRYQFPKRYKPIWLPCIVYVIIDVLGVRDANAQFLYYDVEMLEISKQEYLRLKKHVLKQESENLLKILSWTGGLSLNQVKGLAIWVALVVISAAIGAQMTVESAKAWLEKLQP